MKGNAMIQDSAIDRLVVIVVSGPQGGDLMHQLTQEKFAFTKVDSSGGLVQEPTLCLIVGLGNTRLSALLELIRKVCQPLRQYIPTNLNIQPGYPNLPMIEAQIGGATVYLMNVEQFEQL